MTARENLVVMTLKQVIDEYTLSMSHSTLLRWIDEGIIYAKNVSTTKRVKYEFDADELYDLHENTYRDIKRKLRKPKNEWTQDELIESARAKIRPDGYAQVTLREAAAVADVGESTIYRWFLFDLLDYTDAYRDKNGKYHIHFSTWENIKETMTAVRAYNPNKGEHKRRVELEHQKAADYFGHESEYRGKVKPISTDELKQQMEEEAREETFMEIDLDILKDLVKMGHVSQEKYYEVLTRRSE